MRKSCHIALIIGTLALTAGCFGTFNPDERTYPCDTAEDCIAGYACVGPVPTQTDDVGPVPTQTDDVGPVPTQSDDVGLATATPAVCARKCGDSSAQCPNGFQCTKGRRTTEGVSISVCISIDEIDAGEHDSGSVVDTSIDATLTTPVNNDVGVAVDISFGPEDCVGLGCGRDDMPDAVAAEERDVGMPDNGCHSACTGYCEFNETHCQLPCSLARCVGVCNESDGELANRIIAQSQPGVVTCGQDVQAGAGEEEPIAVQTTYDTLAVSCTEFCLDLDMYLTDSINGAGAVCGDFLKCDQNACVRACEVSTLEFAQNLGELTLNASHAQCPLSAKLLTGVNGSTRSISVKNLCIPCESTCSTLFPNDDSADEGSSASWCGEMQEQSQHQSPCPAISSKSVCTQQCALHPEQFFVSNALEICGDPTSADPVSIIEGNTPLCGAQCESTNTDWGDVGSFTDQPLTLTHVFAGTTRTIVVERGTRICFREQDAASGDHPRCDLVISIDQQRFARFEVVFDPIGQGGSVNDLSENTLRYAAQLTAHGESTVTDNLFLMVISSGFGDMLLRESISNPNAQVYDVETPTLNDGDVALISRRIGADEYRMEFLFNDVQTPSALTIDHFTIGSTQDIDGSCQNQCFERSGGEFCRDLCDPDEGLMALCAQNIDMPRRAQVAFTSNLSASGHPQSPFCAQGEETSEHRLSKDFDADSCLRECKRNRCDLQFQVNALWHPGAANAGGRCHRLNFGGYQGWESDRNFPNENGSLSSEQLCCLCSHEYCDDAWSNTAASFDCGN